ncbi:MAG: hypothetical protein B6D61_01025 [Bacteroidetes bacterium 4484_249]|nr:MAG: hypothetical protein B6D61_01025 [Bacteroidetes bacterium 4484_249]
MRKLIKIVIGILLFLIVLILTIDFLFGFLIKSQIKRLTDKRIELEYKSSKTRILHGTIEFSNAVLQFNDVSIDSNSSIFIKSVSSEKFIIFRLNLKALLFDRSFNIEKVLLRGPSVEFLKDTIINGNDIFSKVLTPDVIRSKSKSAPFSFNIGEVEIEQGSFHLSEADKNDFSVGRVNLKLLNIGMEDLKVLNGKALDLNAHFNIRIGVYDIRKQLEGDAAILIDSAVYNKDDNTFKVGGIQLKRLKSSSACFDSETSLFTGLITVNGFSLRHLLVSKDLKFERFTISNTEIVEKQYYYKDKKRREKKSGSQNRMFSNIIDAFITDTLNIQNFNYYSENNITDSTDFINNLNFWMYSVRVDSNFIMGRKYLRPIEESTVFTGPVSIHKPENGFDLSCDSLVYSGPGKEQKITGLRLSTYPSLFSEIKDQPFLHFITDSIVISGLDEREWIDSTVVRISLYMKNPRIVGSNILFENSNKTGSNVLYADKLVLNELTLLNGNIRIEGTSGEIIESESMNVEAVDLEFFLESSKSNKKVQWKNIFTSVENSTFAIPEKLTVRIDKGTVNNNDLNFEGISYLNNFNYQTPSEKAIDTTRFYSDKVKIDNFDIQAFINEKKLCIDDFKISKSSYFQYSDLKRDDTTTADSVSPILLYRRINKILPQYFSFINIRDFSIADADVLYQTELNNLAYSSSNSVVMHNIKFDKNNGKWPEFTAGYYEFCINDINLISDKMWFNAESACYNSMGNSLTFVNSHADNISGKNKGMNTNLMKYNITIPKIKLTDPDFTPLSGGPVSFNNLYIDNPEIHISVPAHKKIKKLADRDFRILPFPYLEDGIIIENGKADICLAGETDSTMISIGKFGLNANEIYKIIGAAKYHSKDKNLFSYLDFHFKDILLEGSGMNLTIQNVDYDKQSGVITINPIKQEMFHGKYKPESAGFKNLIDVPKVKIEYPDLMLANHKIKSFGAGNLLVPTVNISLETNKKEKPKKNKKIKIAVNDSSFRNFFRKFDFFHIDSTVISDIGIKYKNLSDSAGGTFDIQRISLLVDDLKIDSSHFDSHKKRIAKDIILQLYDKQLVTTDSMYRIRANNVTYYYSRDKIIIDSFEVVPRYDRQTFFDKAQFQTDRMQIKFESAIAEGVDLLSIIESNEFQIRKLTFNKFHMMDHRDQHYPRKENDFKQLPKQALLNLPFVLNIDTIDVKNSFMLYGEYVDKSQEPGEIYFTNFNASAYNVSNLGKIENKPNILHANVTADIMNQARMNLELTIPLDKNADYFWFSGYVERTDLRNFNSMTENLFGISIVRGKGEVEIPLITANEIHSKGTLNFKYRKLKLAMYNRNKARLQRGLGSGLIDFMMNGVLVKSNNPTFLGKPRTGVVYFERNNQRSFFNYIWKSTMSGLMTTLGFYNKELRGEKRERKSDEKDERKDERQIKKLK